MPPRKPRGKPTRPQPARLLLTYEEAADILSISPRTVRVYADQGHLTRVVFPHGRTTRVTAASVTALIKASITKTSRPLTDPDALNDTDALAEAN